MSSESDFWTGLTAAVVLFCSPFVAGIINAVLTDANNALLHRKKNRKDEL